MWVPSALMKQPPTQSTAGAVPVRNEKGEISMEKVKVKRYVSGKRPDYAPMESSDEEDEEFQFIKKAKEQEAEPEEQEEDSSSDSRLRRLQNLVSEDVEEKLARHRKLVEPEVVGESDSEVEGDARRMEREGSSEEEEEEIDDEEIEQRRGMMCQRAQRRKIEELEVMEVEDEGRSGEESESESEEHTHSEEEMEPRLKPVFIRKKDRVTVQEQEAEALKPKELEREAKRTAGKWRKYTLKIVEEEEEEEEEETKKELEEHKPSLAALDALNTDDENEEEYEAWKARELKRIKRDREDREVLEKEKAEIECMRNLTEEERQAELRANGKVITNKAVKGKYKFLQKYYHRGAFFMDEDEEVYKRDFSAPTLEDHFNKTILPKVMQVKNFGWSGRTKYTHLVDQDTTSFDSAWGRESAQNTKFFKQKAAGVRDVFERPSAEKRKTT
ncbi:LOW QUALITY PROTEIN: microfibrillar-associated protein 1-like [Peromyscus eremicus]|uniref:LOW QUALITY PROTEIN: microfibrillar-associated protein 1-like n=1 Tax=Peromyscus eremicus TaxID=42410 RepID=UPI0027DB40F8|nr:LOW QUALITY PROTEIN: microfibrillar-associated protein 1-like [Peromyscus eremicus]